jgi:hypothetical protein
LKQNLGESDSLNLKTLSLGHNVSPAFFDNRSEYTDIANKLPIS